MPADQDADRKEALRGTNWVRSDLHRRLARAHDARLAFDVAERTSGFREVPVDEMLRFVLDLGDQSAARVQAEVSRIHGRVVTDPLPRRGAARSRAPEQILDLTVIPAQWRDADAVAEAEADARTGDEIEPSIYGVPGATRRGAPAPKRSVFDKTDAPTGDWWSDDTFGPDFIEFNVSYHEDEHGR